MNILLLNKDYFENNVHLIGSFNSLIQTINYNNNYILIGYNMNITLIKINEIENENIQYEFESNTFCISTKNDDDYDDYKMNSFAYKNDFIVFFKNFVFIIENNKIIQQLNIIILFIFLII